jgi:hypothetical protein
MGGLAMVKRTPNPRAKADADRDQIAIAIYDKIAADNSGWKVSQSKAVKDAVKRRR